MSAISMVAELLVNQSAAMTLVFSNLLRYMCANNYFSVKRFDKVIAKIKLCSFFASQCRDRCDRYENREMRNRSGWVSKRRVLNKLTENTEVIPDSEYRFFQLQTDTFAGLNQSIN